MSSPRSLSAAVDQIARRTIGKDWNLYAALLERWVEIVGPEYARDTTPVKIAFPPRQNEAQRRGGTLTVRLPKGLAMEFTFKTAQLCQRINAYFGYAAIEKIAFEPVYSLPPVAASPTVKADAAALAALQEDTKSIEDDALRGAVEALGESILASSKA